MIRFQTICAGALVAWLAALPAQGLHAQTQVPDATAAGQTERKGSEPGKPNKSSHLRLVDVTLNQAPVGQWTLLDHEGELYATPEILQQWRISLPSGAASIEFRDASWWPLYALPGYRARFDFSTQALQLEFAPEAFTTTQMKTSAAKPLALSIVSPSVFVNYDLAHTVSRGTGVTTPHSTGVLTEIGLATGMGTLISSQVGRNLGSTDPNLPSEWRRLETTWTKDFHGQNMSLRLGDTSTRASLWGRNMFFGGVQLGTNFGLTPGFLSQPLPTLAGSASSPGTLELYVNNALRQISNVPAGPFTLENFTQITGAGEARVVVRDLLGRETVIVSPFFTSSQLLEQGLRDWSVNLGKERFNLGTLSADYRDAFASGLYRQGLTKTLTLEGRAEWSKPLQTAGVGVNTQLPFLALGQAALATSRDATGLRGSKLLLGLDHQDLSNGVNLRLVKASRDYRELGFGPTERAYKEEQAVNLRHTFDDKASVGLSWARLLSQDQGLSKVITGSYAMRVAERGTLIFSGTRVSGNQSGYTVGVSLVLPLDRQRVVTASMSKTRQGWEGYTAAAEPIGNETGVGWRVLGGHRVSEDYAEGGVYYQSGRGFLGADLATSGPTQTLRLNAQGAAVFMEGRFFAARRLQNSFALVHVPGYPNVGVGFQGETLTQTDKDGFAMLPRLSAYQTNTIRLNANDLPMSAELDSIEATAVPAWRSGVAVKFPVRSGQGALVKVVTPDGAPVPSGTRVELVGDGKEFFVARRGEVFLTGLQQRNTIALKWEGYDCKAQVDLPGAVDAEIIRLGPVTCRETTP
jgi:outer membrane usher protein